MIAMRAPWTEEKRAGAVPGVAARARTRDPGVGDRCRFVTSSLLTIVFGSIPLILSRPFFGIIMWSWIAYMAPHRLTWGVAYDFPVARWSRSRR